MKRGPGRPKLPDKDRRSVEIKVRVRKDERRKALKKAKKAGLTLSELVRQLLRDSPSVSPEED